jgi:predicted DNA binding CopG/RHH family protein
MSISNTIERSEKAFITVNSREEIPSFATEEEEAAFWETHEFSEDLLRKMTPSGDKALPAPRTRPVSIRLDQHTLERSRAIAAQRHIGYQTLLKEFITERLNEQEKRLGIIGERPSS